MALPPPYASAGDRGLVDGCIAGDDDAWKVLEKRHGPLLKMVAVRVLDERRGGRLDEVPGCLHATLLHLQRNQAGPLRTWNGGSFRHYLVAVSRQVMMTHLQDVTPPAAMVASLPTPAAIFLDEVLTTVPAEEVTAALDRLSPSVGSLVRLRLRGLDRDDMAATLGQRTQWITANLERVADRLGEMTEGDDGDAAAAWRMILDASTPGERVRLALRTEDEDALRRVRATVASTWRGVRERALQRLHPKLPLCLDENAAASFVDGTLRGAERTRAEGHVATCPRCTDTVATLAMDVRAADWVRDTSAHATDLALAASCIATTRFRAGQLLAEAAVGDEVPRAREILRLATLGHLLEGGLEGTSEPSRVRAVPGGVPSDEEAPLVALEGLLAGDPHTAARAIDDELAKGTVGARLRLLAAIAGEDLAAGERMARAVAGNPRSDPGLADDADAALALPRGRALPRETLLERIRAVVPQVVRYILMR